jgi:hypothetical protein
MSFEWGERPGSRATTSKEPSFVGRYYAAGTNNSATVKAYALANTPATVLTLEGTLWRNDIQVTPDADGGMVWEVDVFYGRVNRQVGSYSRRWEGTMGTERRFNSLATVASYPGSAPSYGKLIGVDEDRIEGADFPVPSSMFVIEFKHPTGFFNDVQAANAEAIQGHVNSTIFFGRAAGEIMFWSFRGQEGTDAETTIEYTFVRKPNLTGLTVGTITGIDKRGHDHIWFRYTDAISEGRTVRIPQFAYVEQIAPYSDLAAVLGFG